MINPRAVAVDGVGFGPAAMAVGGLAPSATVADSSQRRIALQGVGPYGQRQIALQGLSPVVGPISAGGMGFEMVPTTVTAPRLWWKRRHDGAQEARPAVPATRKKAKALLREVVIDLATLHAAENAPAPQQIAEVFANIEPILPAVPGVDWQSLYQRMRALADQQRAALLAAQDDEEAALLLLLA